MKCQACNRGATEGYWVPNYLNPEKPDRFFCWNCGEHYKRFIQFLALASEFIKESHKLTIGSLSMEWFMSDGEALSLMPDFQYNESIEWQKTDSNNQIAIYFKGQDEHWAIYFGKKDDGFGSHGLIVIQWPEKERTIRSMKQTLELLIYTEMVLFVCKTLGIKKGAKWRATTI